MQAAQGGNGARQMVSKLGQTTMFSARQITGTSVKQSLVQKIIFEYADLSFMTMTDGT